MGMNGQGVKLADAQDSIWANPDSAKAEFAKAKEALAEAQGVESSIHLGYPVDRPNW